MKTRKKHESVERSMAASQILILLAGIVAFSHGIGFVSGDGAELSPNTQLDSDYILDNYYSLGPSHTLTPTSDLTPLEEEKSTLIAFFRARADYKSAVEELNRLKDDRKNIDGELDDSASRLSDGTFDELTTRRIRLTAQIEEAEEEVSRRQIELENALNRHQSSQENRPSPPPDATGETEEQSPPPDATGETEEKRYRYSLDSENQKRYNELDPDDRRIIDEIRSSAEAEVATKDNLGQDAQRTAVNAAVSAGVTSLLSGGGEAAAITAGADAAATSIAAAEGTFGLGPFLGNIVVGAIVAVASYFLISFLQDAGVISESWGRALKPAVVVGSLAGFGVAGLIQGAGGIAIGIGAGVVLGGLIFLLAYEENDQLIANFQCIPWQPPQGGEDCKKCGGDGLPCSEYRCRSLGLGCELLNEEGEDALCEHVTRDDVKPPEIRPWHGALSANYLYENDDAVSPPDRGTLIVRDYGNSTTEDSCVPPFESVSFGIALDEPAICRIDVTRRLFDEMKFTLSNGIYKYNHSTSLNVPGKEALQEGGIDVENGENMSFYLACKDRNGNGNTATFAYTICISNLPDTTPPRVVSTSMANGVPVASGLENADLEIYTNEPVTACRWDRQDLAHSEMENAMTCGQTVNNRGLYTCKATLTGIDEEVENDYYFRCEDKSGNVNQESFKFTLEGTLPLTMDYLKINDQSDGARIKGSTNSVKVTFTAATSQGHDYGAANCHYARYAASSGGGETRGEYRPFSDGSSWTESHKHEDFLTEGRYKYSVRCIDLAGNFDSENISFYVESDTDAPVIARAYEKDGNLKIITSEKAKCVYGKQDGDDSCSYAFEDGIRTSTLYDDEFSEQHFITWDSDSNFYVKCRDEHNNLPAPDQCSGIIRTYVA